MSTALISVKDVTLDSISKSLTKFRGQRPKSGLRVISDQIWLTIFQLEQQGDYDGSQLRALFKLNSAQYKKKYAELIKTVTNELQVSDQIIPTEKEDLAPAFAQVCIENEQIPSLSDEAVKTKQTLKNIKNTKQSYKELLDNKTIIVECIHQDGHRLRIHTTSDRFDDIFTAFIKLSGDMS